MCNYLLGVKLGQVSLLLYLLHLFIPESLSTEKRQLFKVEADLKDKIANLFNGIYFSNKFKST